MNNISEHFHYDLHAHHELVQPRSVYVRKGLSGLVNTGNLCFVNSILQCLSHTLSLTDYFLSGKHAQDDPTRLNERKTENTLLKSYITLLVNIWETNQLLTPKTFTERLGKFIPQYTRGEQQDAHECLIHILHLLHKALSYEVDVEIKGDAVNKTDTLMRQSVERWKLEYESSYSKLVDIFGGMTYSKIDCSNCEFTEDVFEPFNHLSLEISDNIVSCLSKHFNANEAITTWKCEKCHQSGCTRNCRVWTLPNYLIINLKRFTNNGGKIDTHVDFPLDDLNLTSFVSDDKADPNNYIYTLYAVNYHTGGENNGHYYSACKNLDGNWYLFNDGHVSKYQNTTNILNKDAYILFYYRKYIKPTPEQS